MPNNDYILRSDAIDAMTVNALQRNMDTVYNGEGERYWRAAQRVIASLPAADVEPKQRWIPVTERLPESAERYLVMRFDYVAKAPFYDLLWFENGRWWNRHFDGDYAVTHWMPLPEPPKMDKEEYDV